MLTAPFTPGEATSARFRSSVWAGSAIVARALAADLVHAGPRVARPAPVRRQAHVSILQPIVSLRTTLATQWGFGASYQGIRQQIEAAMADDSVGEVVYSIDCPGGLYEGAPELADYIRQCNAVKPSAAHVTGATEGIGYVLAAACNRVYCAPSSQLGGLGASIAHADESAALAAQGIKVTLVSAGQFKVDGNPFEPLSASARSDLQARVNDVMAWQVSVVAKGRGVSEAKVRSDFGRGRAMSATAAHKVGMVDGIANSIASIPLSARSAKARAAALMTPVVSPRVTEAHAQRLAMIARLCK